MKKTTGLAGGIAAAGLAGVVALQAAVAAPGSNHAAVQTRIPLTGTVFTACGAVLVTSGTLHSVDTLNTAHTNYQDVKGVTATGQIVAVSETIQFHANGTKSGFIFQQHVNGQGVHGADSFNSQSGKFSFECSTTSDASPLTSLAAVRWAQTGQVSASAAAHAAPNSVVAQKTTSQVAAAPVANNPTVAPTSPLFRQASTSGLQRSTTASGLTHSSASSKAQPLAGTGTAQAAGSTRFNGHVKSF